MNKTYVLFPVFASTLLLPLVDAQAGCEIGSTWNVLEKQYLANSATVLSGSFCGQSYSINPSLPSTLESGSTISGTIAGFPFTFTSSVPINQIGAHPDQTNHTFTLTVSGVEIYSGSYKNLSAMRNSQTMTFMVGGKPMTFTTNAASWMQSTRTNITTLTYNGATLFSGTERQIGVQDVLNFLGAIGTLDSGSATQQQVNRTTSQVVATVVSSRISAALSQASSAGKGMRPKGPGSVPGTPLPGGEGRQDSSGLTMPITGLSSGELKSNSKGLWGTVGNTWIRGTSAFLPYTGQLKLMLLGGDMKVLKSSLVGVTVGIEDNILNTNYNNGGIDTTGVSITPYFGTSFLDGGLVWNVSASYGASKSNTDRLTPGTMTRVTGSYHARRVMLDTNLDGYLPLSSATTLNLGVGVLGSWDHRGKYTESDNTTPLKNDTGLGEAKVSATLHHTYKSFSGFVGASYLYDFFMDQDIISNNKEDRDEISAKIGFDYAVKDNHTLTLDLNNSFGRENTKITGVMANYRIDF
ncbi:MAG: autotransporter outer membrane beta-barrel domain-containing protein [Magnetococcales bacterium]|nr:autotransporter outer membrane beta-barrel domain-containing protein [Magnetococcales bacterium]